VGPGVASTGPREQLQCRQHDWWRVANPVPHSAEVNWNPGLSTAGDAAAVSPSIAGATAVTSIVAHSVVGSPDKRVCVTPGFGFGVRQKAGPIIVMPSARGVLVEASAWRIMVQKS